MTELAGEGITVDTATGPMTVPWGHVADYFRLVYGWQATPPRRRWWQRRRP